MFYHEDTNFMWNLQLPFKYPLIEYFKVCWIK